MRRAATPWVCAATLLGAGCSLSAPEPIPLAGPAPCSVLVLPAFGPKAGEAGPALTATLAPALRERGYETVPVEVARATLDARGVASGDARPAEDWVALARELGADAFMTLRVEEFDAVYAPHLQHLRYDLGYQLWSAAHGELLWELRSSDEASWEPGAPVLDPQSSRDGYFTPMAVGRPSSPYADRTATARAIHARALALLPRGPVG